MVDQHALGHRLVQGQSQGEHLGAGVGNAQHLEHGRHLGLARITEMPLADIETDIWLVLAYGVVQADIAFQEFTGVAAAADGLHQRVDCFF